MSDFISDIKLYWQPYVFSQIASLILLYFAWKNTRIARGMLSFVFFGAFVVNTLTAINHPNAYLDYADQAIPVYSDFIHGWFSQHHMVIVLAIAAGQALIAIGMSLKGWLMRGACIGSILFLLSIAPLMVGSAFPFSITVSFAVWLVLRQDDGNYLWKKQSGPLVVN